jgi:hypothetical protein
MSRFRTVAKVSGLCLIGTSAAVASIYGVAPVIRVNYAVRGAVLLIWFWNVCAFAVSGGMLLWARLVDRYGDRI